jgi:hypothetical protein
VVAAGDRAAERRLLGPLDVEVIEPLHPGHRRERVEM